MRWPFPLAADDQPCTAGMKVVRLKPIREGAPLTGPVQVLDDTGPWDTESRMKLPYGWGGVLQTPRFNPPAAAPASLAWTARAQPVCVRCRRPVRRQVSESSPALCDPRQGQACRLLRPCALALLFYPARIAGEASQQDPHPGLRGPLSNHQWVLREAWRNSGERST